MEAHLENVIDLVKNVGEESKLDSAALSSLHPDTSFEKELGLDSLTQMELLNRVEDFFGVRLEMEIFAHVDTPRQLARVISRAEVRGPHEKGITRKEKISLNKEESEAPLHPGGITLLDAMRRRYETTPKRTHIRFYQDDESGEEISFELCWKKSSSLALGLSLAGIQEGERVAIMLPTCAEYFYSFIGTLMLGAVPVPVYPPVQKSQLKEHVERHIKIFNNCEAKLLIAPQGIEALSAHFKRKSKTLKTVRTPESLMAEPAKDLIPARRSGEDLALIQYTSGSTGDPKGVALTNQQILENIRSMGEALKITPNEVIASWLPLYHDMGLIGSWMGAFYFGAPLILMTPQEFIARPSRWLWAIHRYGVTLSASPNFGYELCVKRAKIHDLEGLDLSTWRAALNGAEPVSAATLRSFAKTFSPYGFDEKALMPVYGLAENAVGLCFPPLNSIANIKKFDRDLLLKEEKAMVLKTSTDLLPVELPSCGKPLPGNRIRIVGEAGETLDEDIVGEIEFKGSSTTTGYFHNPQKTRELFHGRWARTGDLGFIHSGELYISGRKKDLIIKAGRNIHPQELEEAIGNLAGVRKGCVAVFAVTNVLGEEPKLIVAAETREKDPVLKKRMMKVITKLGRDILEVNVDETILLPPHSVLKTSSGKIRRAATKEAYIKGKLKPSMFGNLLLWQTRFWLMSELLAFKGKIRNLFFKAGGALYGLRFFASLSLVLFPVALWIFLAPFKLKRIGIYYGLKVFIWLAGVNFKANGLQYLDPSRNYVFIANHKSYLDAPLIAGFVDMPIVFTAKEELLRNPLYRILLTPLKTVFIDRKNYSKALEKLKQARELFAKEKISLCFFPEGTITEPEEMERFRMGAFVLAAQEQAALVPVLIKGTQRVLGHVNFWPRKGIHIELNVLAPLETSQGEIEKDVWRQAVALRESAQREIMQERSTGR